MSTPQMDRRTFLKFSVAASGGLLIGLYLPGASKLAAAVFSRVSAGLRREPFIWSRSAAVSE